MAHTTLLPNSQVARLALAVLLEIPKDGSVPDVLPWQSLRKCAFAAPRFHDELLPIPTMDERGIPETSCQDEETPPTAGLDDTADDPNKWKTWTKEALYDVERIIGARRVGRGWKIAVKWDGCPDATEEPLHAIKVTDPELFRQIETCKENYLLQHPKERTRIESEDNTDEGLQVPTRILPLRLRKQTQHFTYAISTSPGAATAILKSGMGTLRTYARTRCRAANLLTDDIMVAMCESSGLDIESD